MKNLNQIRWWAKACQSLGVTNIKGICLHYSGGKNSRDCSQEELKAVERGLKATWLHTRFKQIQEEHRGEMY